MGCTDTCVVMDCDSANDFYREITRHARKPHECCECGNAIAVGEPYRCATGRTEGDFWDARTCLVCHEIRTTFVCDTWIFGELWEAIRDQLFWAWDEMRAIDCLARLTTQGAVEKVRQEYARFLGDNDL